MKKETYTIIKKGTDTHYATDDERFYGDAWERTQDSKEYLKMIIYNNTDKFKGCIIIDNNK